MRKTFAALDDALIERLFQPLSDLVFYRMGAGAAACFCVDIASLCWIVSRAPGLSDAVASCDAGSASLNLAFLLLGLAALISLRLLFRRVAGKCSNGLRLAMQPHRAIVLMMLISRLVQLRAPGLTDAADVAMLVFATAALYLGACTQRPPLRRVAEALQSAA